MNLSKSCFSLAALGVTWVMSAAAACESIPLLEPAPGATVAEPAPGIRWAGEPHSLYRVQLAVITPEVGPREVFDLQVRGSGLAWPAALVQRRSAVKLLISRDCPWLGSSDLHALPPRFVIDPLPRCQLHASAIRPIAHGLAWDAVEGADSYRVRRLSAGDFRWGQGWSAAPVEQVAQPRWQPAKALAPDELIVIEAVCPTGAGPAAVWP